MGDDAPEEPLLVSYEWMLLCPCGARIDLATDPDSKLATDDVELETYSHTTEWIRSIEGERTFDCYNCPRELTVSIDKTGITKWEATDA